MTDRKPLEEPLLSKFPSDKYMQIQEAGRSYFRGGAVIFCLPKEALKTIPATLSTEDLKALRKKIVAIKVTEEDARREANNLNQIFATEASDKYTGIQSRFLAAGPCEETWIELSALEPSLTLSSFVKFLASRKVDVPPEFVAHVLVDLLRTLEFLHEECGLTHNDIHSENILLDLRSQRDVKRFPNLVLIDFGTSKPAIPNDIKEDVSTFCSVISEVANRCVNIASGLNLKLLQDFMFGVQDWENVQEFSLKDIQDLFQEQAIDCKNSVTQGTVDALVKLIEEAVNKYGEKIADQTLLEAVTRAIAKN